MGKKNKAKVNESAGETHLRFCEKKQRLPADVLLDPDDHKKRSKWDCSGVYYSHDCARERRDEGKIPISQLFFL